MKPLLLLTNDDGIDSPYLGALADSLESDGFDVLVAAPEKPRSAMSQSITLHKPLRVNERAPGRFAVSGTPVDCTYIGLLKLAPRPPTLVVSGINDGYNLGTDAFYSGTVGAAMEGGLRGHVGVALSTRPGLHSIPSTIDLSRKIVRAIADRELPPGTVINANIPRDAKGGFKWTRLGRRFYGDDIQEREDPRGRAYYWIGGGHIAMGDEPGTDCVAVTEGFISLSPLRLNLTSDEQLPGLSTWELDGLRLSQ